MSVNRRSIAETTLVAVSAGKVTIKGRTYDIRGKLAESTLQTVYYAPDSLLSAWQTFSPAQTHPAGIRTVIEILKMTTLDAARTAALKGRKMPIGPGGGFIEGSSAQEESIARSSTLYSSLMTPTAQQFYSLHSAHGKGGFYSHAMVYSPHVVIFRANDGTWATPMEIDVLTSPRGARRSRAQAHEGSGRRSGHRAHDAGAHGAHPLPLRAARAAVWAIGAFGASFHYVAFAVMDDPTYWRFSRAFEKAKRR
ncbi:hypothetical protein DFH09DRAFT_1168046 [Mycena vulgaris]|nr:hypothetical protein DFH09DRAFT_1168046 [Mycena vulgaris]